jgi:hypothetical protein
MFDNLAAALERRDRVRRIDIADPPKYWWEEIVTAMQGPFPALRYLSLVSLDEVLPPLPDTLLNGYAPCLQGLTLGKISLPTLPKFLWSTSNLTSLRLFGIVQHGFIPPETMATFLSALPKLKSLKISFDNNLEMPTPHPQRGNRASLPPTRFVLSALTVFDFAGVGNYLEALAARIDAPLLDEFYIHFFHHELGFDIPQTIRLFSHLDSFRPSSLTLEFIRFHSAFIYFPSRHSGLPSSWNITGQQLDWQVNSVAQICSQILPFRSTIKSLNVKYEDYRAPSQPIQHEIAPTLWSQLFHTFTSVHSLYIPSLLELSIAAGLTGESAAELFPSLRNLFVVRNTLDNTAQQGIQSFIAARQQSGRPVAVFRC